MECVRLKSPPDTAEWKSGDQDCLWILMQGQTVGKPLSTKVLQWVDWKLKGALSQYVQRSLNCAQTTFIPTINRLPTNYLAVEGNRAVDWDAFLRNCEGMKLKKVLVLSANEEAVKTAERELKARKSQAYPEVVQFGADVEL